MSLVCRDGVSYCSGCGMCLNYSETCDSCNRKMNVGELYYRFSQKIICKDCTEASRGDICIFCRRPARDGIRYKDVVLCRSCSRVATGYVGYI
ncbi:MAG: hypothetical protein IKL24_06785 [Clostridia bacterium]|nr:hypothetical protein [Clostridia bacterium]